MHDLASMTGGQPCSCAYEFRIGQHPQVMYGKPMHDLYGILTTDDPRVAVGDLRRDFRR